jgi:glycogen operon protein
VLEQVKLIAEPWDVGDGGYQVGNFPQLWAEWNDKYRDTVRGFWRGDERKMADLGYRLTGSSDLYGDDGRAPMASINFVTAHDGFTLHDVVSYDSKHNEANGEENRDGSNNIISSNYGSEGVTDDPAILDVRYRQMRNFLATLLFSQGVPMLCGGDEIARTLNGNNNAYAQDNEISWYNWNLDDRRRALLDFTRELVRLRREHPALRRRKFFRGRSIHGGDVKDIVWLRPDGQEMTDTEWDAVSSRSIGMRLEGGALNDVSPTGDPIVDDDLLLLFNANDQPVRFTAPAALSDGTWQLEIATADLPTDELAPGAVLELPPRCLALYAHANRQAAP